MSDKELLEFAAKAGVVAGTYIQYIGDTFSAPSIGMTDRDFWNPLIDDGHALRLAVQCSLEVSLVDDEPVKEGKDTTACVGYSIEGNDKIQYVFEYHGGDIFSATRRAIVRAAAEIGKTL